MFIFVTLFLQHNLSFFFIKVYEELGIYNSILLILSIPQNKTKHNNKRMIQENLTPLQV